MKSSRLAVPFLTLSLLIPLAGAACSTGQVLGGATGADGGPQSEGTPSESEGGTALPTNRDAGQDAARPGRPPGAKVAFLTSANFSGNLRAAVGSASAPRGAAAGDTLCQAAAEGASLTGTFRAYLTDSTATAFDRMTATGPWYTVSGKMAFATKSALRSTALVMLEDEHGALSGTEMWIGGASATCGDWQSDDYVARAMVGSASRLNGVEQSCEQTAGLYCFEQ